MRVSGYHRPLANKGRKNQGYDRRKSHSTCCTPFTAAGRVKRKSTQMISIKKYLESDDPVAHDSELELNALSSASIKCYRAALLAFGATATQVSAAFGGELDSRLRRLERRLSFDVSPDSIAATESYVEAQLQEWGSRTSGHFKLQADTVKELLIALAHASGSVISSNQGYAKQFEHLTRNLEKIGDLHDLTQIRASLVQSVSELKNSVDQMTRENHQLVSQLQAEISTYETRLMTAEQLAFKDGLTGVANRRAIDERIQLNIKNRETFCILMLDLNGLKRVNDQHGHHAGDELLRQFATELQSTTRSGDLVGRLGGDEFIIVMMCDAQGAKGAIQKVRDWVFGKYNIHGSAHEPVVLIVDAAIGYAEWSPEKSAQQLMDEADAAMYFDKVLLKSKS